MHIHRMHAYFLCHCVERPEAGKPEGRQIDDLGEGGCAGGGGGLQEWWDWERESKQKGQRFGKAADHRVTEIKGGALVK